MLKCPCMNAVTYFCRRRGNETLTSLSIPGGTGYQPVAVGNLPTDCLFIASPLPAKSRILLRSIARFCVVFQVSLVKLAFGVSYSFTKLTDLNHQSSKILCSLATSVARNYAKLREVTFNNARQIKNRQKTSRSFLNLFYTYCLTPFNAI